MAFTGSSAHFTHRFVAVIKQHCLLSSLHKNAIIASSRQLLFHSSSVTGFSATETFVRTCLPALGVIVGNYSSK